MKHFLLNRKVATFGVAIVVVALLVALRLRMRAKPEPLPRVVIQTVVKIPALSKGKKRKAMINGYVDLIYWIGLRPASIDSQEQVALFSDYGQLLLYDQGNLRRSLTCSGLHQIFLLRHGASTSFWVVDYVQGSKNGFWRLVKIDGQGKILWQKSFPSSEEIDDIQVDAKGHVFVLNKAALMRQFDANGKALASYQLKDKGSQPDEFQPRRERDAFSAVVTQDGTIYCHPFGLSGKDGWITMLPVDRWKSPTQKTTRSIDISPFGPVSPQGIRLMAVDSAENLYFQYFDARVLGGDTNLRIINDDINIGIVDKSGRARKIFSAKEHYDEELRRVQTRWGLVNTRGIIGIGNLLHVTDRGDLYLEVAMDKEYRIDKISFAETTTSTQE